MPSKVALFTGTSATKQDKPMAPCDSDGMRLLLALHAFAVHWPALCNCEFVHSRHCGSAGQDMGDSLALSSQCGVLQARSQVQSTAGAVAPDSILAHLLREAVRTRGISSELSEPTHQHTAQMADGCQSSELIAEYLGKWSAADNGNSGRAHPSLLPKVGVAFPAAQPSFGSPAQGDQVQQMSVGQVGQAEGCSRPAVGLQKLAEKCCFQKLPARI